MDKERKIIDEADVVAYFRAFSESDFTTMESMMHPDCFLEFPGSTFGGRINGREAIMGMFRQIQFIMGGSLVFHCKWAMKKDAMAAVHWFTTGTPAHGGKYLNRGVAWFLLEDGRIREFQDFLDTQILDAFWPGAIPCTDFAPARQLIERLQEITPREALACLAEL